MAKPSASVTKALLRCSHTRGPLSDRRMGSFGGVYPLSGVAIPQLVTPRSLAKNARGEIDNYLGEFGWFEELEELKKGRITSVPELPSPRRPSGQLLGVYLQQHGWRDDIPLHHNHHGRHRDGCRLAHSASRSSSSPSAHAAVPKSASHPVLPTGGSPPSSSGGKRCGLTSQVEPAESSGGSAGTVLFGSGKPRRSSVKSPDQEIQHKAGRHKRASLMEASSRPAGCGSSTGMAISRLQNTSKQKSALARLDPTTSGLQQPSPAHCSVCASHCD